MIKEIPVVLEEDGEWLRLVVDRVGTPIRKDEFEAIMQSGVVDICPRHLLINAAINAGLAGCKTADDAIIHLNKVVLKG